MTSCSVQGSVLNDLNEISHANLPTLQGRDYYVLYFRNENTEAQKTTRLRSAGKHGWQPGPGPWLCSHVPRMSLGLPQYPYHRTIWTKGQLKGTACQHKHTYLAFYWFQNYHWNHLLDPQNNPLRWAGQRMFALSDSEVRKEAEKPRDQKLGSPDSKFRSSSNQSELGPLPPSSRNPTASVWEWSEDV